MRRLFVPLVIAAVAGTALPALAHTAGPPTVLRTVSNRADLISGGNALVQVELPKGKHTRDLRVSLDGRDVSRAFAMRSNHRVQALITGLRVGPNSLVASTAGGRAAGLVITNHPIGGPVLAGAQVQPWTCTTEAAGLGRARDAQCDAPSVVTYSYKDAVTGQFGSYDPKRPPPSARVATTNTDGGHTVPYVVRVERGVIDRGIFEIAMLATPSQHPSPFSRLPGWDGKLGFTFGQSCSPGHSQGTAQSALDDVFLSRGYLHAVSTMNVNGNSCNGNTSAESLMMIKEHIAEAYGPIRFTVGDGCSGGAEQQHMIADKYPGLLDGIRPECDFPDLWTPAIFEKYACAMFTHYLSTPTGAALFGSPVAQGAVLGGALTPGDCAEQSGFDAAKAGGAFADWQPDGFGCNISGSFEYDPATNRKGVRCDLQDYNVASLGRRPDGFANRPIDTVGVQWGLQALLGGQITPAQFTDLNASIGSYDLDMRWTSQRTAADPGALTRMYRNDELAYEANLALLPEIDARTDSSYDEHSNVMRTIDRARRDRSNGNHAGQVYWTEPTVGAVGMATPGTHALSLEVVDQWITRIQADHRPLPQARKVVLDAPASARDACVLNGAFVAQTACDTVQTSNELPIQVAGAPATGDVLKCTLKPLRRTDYPDVIFTENDWARLQQTFTTGVCDWTKPGIGQSKPTGSWLDYTHGSHGTPLAAAPRSRVL